MKIALVLDDSLDRSDGVQQYVLSLGRWLSTSGHTVHYLVGQTNRRDIAHIHSLTRNVHVRFNGNRLSVPLPAKKTRLKKLLETEKFDILHIQAPFSPLLGGQIIQAAPQSTTVIATFHIIPYGSLQRMASKLLASVSRRSLRRIDAAISVSEAAQAFTQSTFGLHSKVVPNMIDSSYFHNNNKTKQRDPTTSKKIVFLGRHVRRKGCIELLRAVNLLCTKTGGESFNVIVGGSGPLTPQLVRYVTRHGLEESVKFTGFIPESEKQDFLSQADIAVFPSYGGESFGIVLTEAMAAGAGAVLGGNNGGYRCVLGEWPECLFDPRDTVAFAECLRRFLGDSALADRINQAQQQSVGQYSTEHVGPAVEQFYKTAIAKNPTNKDN
jgi:phosphatidylinositol alpha-mannosyltransferase